MAVDTITPQRIRAAIDTPNVGYELGRLVGLTEATLRIPASRLGDRLRVVLCHALEDTIENDRVHRHQYLLEKLEGLDLEFILEPVLRPQDFTGNVRSDVAEQLACQVEIAGILDLEAWRREDTEACRDERIQAKYARQAGK